MRRPKTKDIVISVARVTFLDMVKDRVLYNFILVSGLLFLIGYLASSLSAANSERVILDFGFSAVAISCSLVAIFSGSGLLSREFDRRTIHLALSRPVSRLQFILGKYVGLVFVLCVNWLLVSCGYFLVLFLLGSLGTTVSPAMILGLILILIQCLLIAGVAIVFSTFTTSALSGIFSIGFYLIGSNVSQLRLLSERIDSVVGRWSLKFIAAAVPNLEYFNVGSLVTYGGSVSVLYILVSLLYGAVVIALLILIAGLLIQSREV